MYQIYFREELIKEFESREEAYEHFRMIERKHPDMFKECKIVDTEEWAWQDSGIEQGL